MTKTIMTPEVIPVQITEAWRLWGDGSVLDHEFVLWLADRLNSPSPASVSVLETDYSAVMPLSCIPWSVVLRDIGRSTQLA